jgi:metal-responsive CopG/Arc/MetJ family transcriptional regulator
MTTISISIDDRSKQQLDQIAEKTNRSRSDVVRDMISWYELKLIVDAMQQKVVPLFRRLGLETDDQIAEYASKN